MIYTLTANPAIDMNFDSKTINPSEVNRTSNLVYSPNGKGVNVSLTLKYFDISSVVLGFFGGFTGKYIIDELKKKDIEVRPSWIEEDTRINSFINVDGEEYKFANAGPNVDKNVQAELIEEIKSALDCDTLVISGSLPKNVNESFYEEVVKCCKERNIEVVLDISSKKLRDLLKYNPKLIKPNDEEIEAIFGFKIKNEDDILQIMNFLHKEGAQSILLTLGEKGMYFYNGEKMYYCAPHKVNLVSSACCGDACLASFLSEWLKDKNNIEFALKKGASIGANVAESHGLGNFGNYKNYIDNIQIREVVI
ncbi:MAG: 1-phosphofructokinase family hexose kinase [Peptostreptococcaceae bacterium]